VRQAGSSKEPAIFFLKFISPELVVFREKKEYVENRTLENEVSKMRTLIFFCFSLVFAMPTGPDEVRHLGAKLDPSLLAEIRGFGMKMPATDGGDHAFPKGFMWGIATSAFQSDGGGGKTDWDKWFAEKGIRPGFVGFTNDDILLAKQYGISCVRTSIEWAKIEPAEGVWDEKELDRSFQLAKFATRHGVRMMINLSHTTLPQWGAAKGGWENDDFPALYAAYVLKVAKKVKPLGIEYWMTLNEPTAVIAQGYVNGVFPPFRKGDFARAMSARRNMIRAHRAGYEILHRICDTRNKKVKVGIAHLVDYYAPATIGNENDEKATAALQFALNVDFIDAIEDHLDYIGLNYYSGWMIKFNPWSFFFGSPVEYVNTRSGKDSIYPEGIYRLIREFSRYRKPILITENGVDDGTDTKRPAFIMAHLLWVQKAAAEASKDAPVIGYFYWTLFDNYEWTSKGDRCTSHFGLFSIDPTTNQRVPRPSAFLFRDIARANALTSDMLARVK
jgi:beta-glucosidase